MLTSEPEKPEPFQFGFVLVGPFADAVRPIFGPPAVRFFRLVHDAGLAAPS